MIDVYSIYVSLESPGGRILVYVDPTAEPVAACLDEASMTAACRLLQSRVLLKKKAER